MIHRFGALLVGLVLVLGVSNLRMASKQEPGALNSFVWRRSPPVFGCLTSWLKPTSCLPKWATSRWLSLLHLVVGVGAFLAAVVLMFATLCWRTEQHVIRFR